MNRFNLKTTKPRSTNMYNPPNPKPQKKIDNVNTEFIRYISEREEKKIVNQGAPLQRRNEEEEE